MRPPRACAEILAGLDEDTLEYVSGGIVDIEDKDELVDFVAGMLDELCDAERRRRARQGECAVGSSPRRRRRVRRRRSKPRARTHLPRLRVSALEAKTIAEAEAARGQFAAKEIKFDHAVSTAGNSAAAKMPPASPRARRSSPRRRRARRNSSRPNSRTPGCAPRACAHREAAGSRLAVAELGPFNLPNPGGGADLLENATATLAPGHRYGLIGRNGKGKSTLLKFRRPRRVPSSVRSLNHRALRLAGGESHAGARGVQTRRARRRGGRRAPLFCSRRRRRWTAKTENRRARRKE